MAVDATALQNSVLLCKDTYIESWKEESKLAKPTYHRKPVNVQDGMPFID